MLMVGSGQYIVAAQKFFKALKVYPNTPELIEIYRKTCPEVLLPFSPLIQALFNLIMAIQEMDEAETQSQHSMD